MSMSMRQIKQTWCFGLMRFSIHCDSFRVIAVGALLVSLVAGSPYTNADGGPEDHSFELPGIDDSVVKLTRRSASPVNVIFLVGTECPLVKIYASRVSKTVQEINRSHPKHSPAVRLIGLCSTVQDSIDDLQAFADDQQIEFTLAKDFDGSVGKRLGATRTSEVLVLDQDLAIRYQGRVDDEYEPGVSRTKVTRHDLRQAIDEILAGRPVSVPVTKPVGCLIGYATEGPVTTELTYTRDIAPILDRQCNECHRRGDIGPFALTDYAEVVGWGPMMVEVIDEQRMPPWHADPKFGTFVNARHMPDSEKQMVRDWVDGGMPYGDLTDLQKETSPASLAIADDGSEWQFSREPDLIVSMSDHSFEVPADQSVDYQYYVVDPGFKEDTWVVGTEVQPGNRSVVHHCIVFIRPPDDANFRGVGWLGAYVPGQRGAEFPEGYARRIPAGSKLVFQMHYTPTGTKQTDQTRIGLLLGKEENVTHEIITLTAINSEFEIPPNAQDHAVRASIRRLPERGELLAIAPHMHLRGKSFRVFAEPIMSSPDSHASDNPSSSEILLSVPHYDFNWQHVYAFADPLPLSSVDKIWFEATFDNSSSNPFNPDPAAAVFWGDQTDEEMAIGFFEVSIPRQPIAQRTRTVKAKSDSPQLNDEERRRAKQFAEQYIHRWDANHDGKLVSEELPKSIARFGMDQLDRNRNGVLETDEIERLYQQHLKKPASR